MTGAIIIACVTILAWILLRFFDRRRAEQENPGSAVSENTEVAEEEECCGAHSYCVKLLPRPVKPVYFDDEELDRFSGKSPEEYTEEETEEFRDILLTLRPEEAPEWAQSLRMRDINVPDALLEELNLLISEELQRRK